MYHHMEELLSPLHESWLVIGLEAGQEQVPIEAQDLNWGLNLASQLLDWRVHKISGLSQDEFLSIIICCCRILNLELPIKSEPRFTSENILNVTQWLPTEREVTAPSTILV